MSSRPIAPIVGVSNDTTQRDISGVKNFTPELNPDEMLASFSEKINH
ncbi:hypothetical protein [Leucobacter aridicollis]|nr:hypothetical protein [Leucobacter aridicollis]UTX53383.1 hypothetical protein KI794_01050 [Leucobacter aridicollis]